MPRIALPTDIFKKVDDMLVEVREVLGRVDGTLGSVDTTLAHVDSLLTELRGELDLLHRLPALADKVDDMHAMLQELVAR